MIVRSIVMKPSIATPTPTTRTTVTESTMKAGSAAIRKETPGSLRFGHSTESGLGFQRRDCLFERDKPENHHGTSASARTHIEIGSIPKVATGTSSITPMLPSRVEMRCDLDMLSPV